MKQNTQKKTEEKIFGNRTTKIKACSCDNEYQDKQYGKGMRVHNVLGVVKGDNKSWCCTVCNKKG